MNKKDKKIVVVFVAALIAISIYVPAGGAEPEGAWVLWAEDVSNSHWSVLDAAMGINACEEKLSIYRKREQSRKSKIEVITKTHIIVTAERPFADIGEDAGSRPLDFSNLPDKKLDLSGLPDKRPDRAVYFLRYLCLPDTIDPR